MVDFQCKERYDYSDLLQIMKLLREPGGCPWDREQDHQSIRRNFLEETCEAVEAIEVSPVEGVRSTGASFLEEIIFGVIPQVFPLWISYSLYRFEANVRSATVVGMVGAGGIGMVLWELFRSFNFQQTCAVMAIIVLVVTLFDLLSQRLRKMVL